jgi:hypothetical protein
MKPEDGQSPLHFEGRVAMSRKQRVICLLSLLLIIAMSSVSAQGIKWKETEPIICTGKVTDSDGLPVSGASVMVYYNHSKWGLGNRIVEECESATDGSFIFTKPLSYSTAAGYPYHRDSFVIFATHPDYALGWRKIERKRPQRKYELVLTEPVSQTVTVTDHAGNPLAGARVWPYNIGNPTDNVPEFQDYLWLPTDEGIIGGTTGAGGKAVISNLPRTRRSFYATLEGYARGLSFSGKKPIRLSRAGIVKGSVLTEDGEPVAGALVRFRAGWMWQFFLTRTNSQGKFHFGDLPAQGWDMSPWGSPGGASGRYTVGIEHDSYTTWETQIDLEPGQTIGDLVIDALAGTLVKCRVLEVGTDNPVGGARIIGWNECGRIDGYSAPDGMFAIRVLPGKTRLLFQSPPEGFYVDGGMRLPMEDIPESRLDFEAEGSEMSVTLRTPRIAGHMTSIKGVVLGLDREPQDEAVVHASTESFMTANRGYIPPVGVDKNGRFELRDVPAGRRVYLYAATNDGTLAGTAELDVSAEIGKTQLIRVKLQPTRMASVVVKDQTGFLLSNTRLRIRPMVEGHRMPRCERNASTNEEGLLEIDGILPGLEYYLQELRGRSAGIATSRIVRRGDEREPFRGALILIPGEYDSDREPTSSEANRPAKERSSFVPDQTRTQGGTFIASLLTQPLPDFEQIDVEFTPERAIGKRFLVCLWDMEQRPSRNCIISLAKQAEELKRRGVIAVAVHASKLKKNKLEAWLKKNNIPFPAGTVEGDEAKIRFAWAVKSLPWLILTDKKHVVRAEGFGIDQLDTELAEIDPPITKEEIEKHRRSITESRSRD